MGIRASAYGRDRFSQRPRRWLQNQLGLVVIAQLPAAIHLVGAMATNGVDGPQADRAKVPSRLVELNVHHREEGFSL
jgi:hypothetical protein